jgi:outer membrane lipoprotein-sorting protein
MKPKHPCVAAALSALALLTATAATAEEAKPQAPAAATAGVDGWQTEKDPRGITLDERQTEVVKQVSKYFSDLKTLKGTFVQTQTNAKPMRGKFFVMRPGKFRFDYAAPSKQIIVSDGEYLAIQDLDLNNEDRVALDQTPFRLLLRKDVDLLRDALIVEVSQAEDLIVVAIQDKSPESPGRIKLFMSTKPGLELKEWVTTDAQGIDTRIQIADLASGGDLDAKMFKIQDIRKNMGLQ